MFLLSLGVSHRWAVFKKPILTSILLLGALVIIFGDRLTQGYDQAALNEKDAYHSFPVHVYFSVNDTLRVLSFQVGVAAESSATKRDLLESEGAIRDEIVNWFSKQPFESIQYHDNENNNKDVKKEMMDLVKKNNFPVKNVLLTGFEIS